MRVPAHTLAGVSGGAVESMAHLERCAARHFMDLENRRVIQSLSTASDHMKFALIVDHLTTNAGYVLDVPIDDAAGPDVITDVDDSTVLVFDEDAEVTLDIGDVTRVTVAEQARRLVEALRRNIFVDPRAARLLWADLVVLLRLDRPQERSEPPQRPPAQLLVRTLHLAANAPSVAVSSAA